MIHVRGHGQTDLPNDLSPHVQRRIGICPFGKWQGRPGVRGFLQSLGYGHMILLLALTYKAAKESVQHHLVDITPTPILTRLDRLHDGMLASVKMLGGVFVLGGIATSDVATRETHSQVDPLVTHLQAFFAAVGTGLYVLDFLNVRTS